MVLLCPVVFLKLPESVSGALLAAATGMFGALTLLIKQNAEALQQNRIINSEVSQPVGEKN
jgi:hypothetical protein